MEKLLKLIQKLGIELTADQTKMLLYPEPPDNTASAISQGLKFLNLGKEADPTKLNQPQVYRRVSATYPSFSV